MNLIVVYSTSPLSHIIAVSRQPGVSLTASSIQPNPIRTIRRYCSNDFDDKIHMHIGSRCLRCQIDT